jgi:hypothetical protein
MRLPYGNIAQRERLRQLLERLGNIQIDTSDDMLATVCDAIEGLERRIRNLEKDKA